MQNFQDAENLSQEEWQLQRKRMESNQFKALQSLGYVE